MEDRRERMVDDKSAEAMVSVIMITYNHEQFIAQAIRGVLMQKTNFKVELIIADDLSPDNTEAEVKKAVSGQEHFVSVTYVKHTRNKGMHKNFAWAYQQCKGKYIALCEGDDYWTDPGKLQKQFDFMEQHPSATLCFHNILVVTPDGKEAVLHKPNDGIRPVILLTDLVKANYIPTASSFWVNFRYQEWPAWHEKLFCGDWPLFFDLALSGSVHYIDEVMAAYRVHGGGVYSKLDSTRRIIGVWKVQQAFAVQLVKKGKIGVLPSSVAALMRTAYAFARLRLRNWLKPA